PMRRRTMIKWAGAGTMLLGAGKMLPAYASSPGQQPLNRSGAALGVQLYTVRDSLQADVRGTLAAIAAIGYQEVELFGLGGEALDEKPLFGLTAKEFAAALEDVGLRAPMAHIQGNAMNIAEIAEVVQPVGVRQLVVPLAPEFVSFEGGQFRMIGVTGRSQLDAIAERLNRQGELAKANGMGFGYHNHQMEFADLGDQNAFDYLFSQADAELVKIELDIGWAVFAGIDPLAVLNRYAGRVIAVHLKDHAPPPSPASSGEPDPASLAAQLVEPGTGPTDFAPILAALDKTGVAHRFVEVDVSPEPVNAITRGYGYLSGL
ncbi:MAG: sugar phosphate isomerase/epimerase, partial [Gammaproteobacteria bacterium]|nr:sugar phosphate isomerase/epimerase [Gammaproteobacteria bacterium]